MPTAETTLETFTEAPPRPTTKPPLLFVHGGYSDGWCWTPYFLPWFAARGHLACALSLRGHGRSAGHDGLFFTSLDDYEADVEHVASSLPAPPVLIGHSMGAAIVERILAKRPVRGAALLAPVPPTGLVPMAARLAAENPEYLVRMAQLDPNRMTAGVLAALRPYYFSKRVDPAILREALRHLNSESPRAIFDLSMRLHWVLPPQPHGPVFVLGAEDDRICVPDEVRATAIHHGVVATLVPGLAHMLMLEPEWETAARALADWIDRLD